MDFLNIYNCISSESYTILCMDYVKLIAEHLLENLLFTAFWWAILLFSMHKDRSRYRNTLFLALAILNTIPLLMMPFENSTSRVPIILFVLVILLIIIVPFMLIANGILMLKKEGKSMANLLSLFLGIIILLGEFFTVMVTVYPYFNEKAFLSPVLSRLPLLMMLFIAAVIYGSICFVSFMFYTLFLQIIPVKRDFDYVIILGAGLIQGDKVSKLLGDRLDKAIQIYQKDPTPPVLIPSGGQGKDETRAEADAMADYLISHGIPEDHIIRENKSINTWQNLTNCKKIIDEQPGRKYTVVVTSNYHVYRALRYAKDIGLKCTGVGSHVAPYYWPSALIREFAAIHKEKKHSLLFMTGMLLVLLPILLMGIIK